MKFQLEHGLVVVEEQIWFIQISPGLVQCHAISMKSVMLDAIFPFKFNNFKILNPDLDML
jgi:hypothetical protein